MGRRSVIRRSQARHVGRQYYDPSLVAILPIPFHSEEKETAKLLILPKLDAAKSKKEEVKTNLPFPLGQANQSNLDPIARLQNHSLLTIRQRHVLPKRRVQYISQQPRERTPRPQMPELKDAEIEVVVLATSKHS